MSANIEKNVKSEIEKKAPGSVLIHSDLMRGFNIKFHKGDRAQNISEHYQKLRDIFEGISIYMPSFSYKFLSEKLFNVQQSPSEVGVLSEYFRIKQAAWRTRTPVFSFSGTGENNFHEAIEDNITIDPFGPDSFFQFLFENNSLLFHYGSEFKHSTILHYIERKLGTVPYRYDKLFNGTVTDAEASYQIKFKYHVRPMGTHLEYDWSRLTADLVNEGILFMYNEGNTHICCCSVAPLVDFLYTKLQEDPYCLLDEVSKQWVIPSIERIGRNLLISDFE